MSKEREAELSTAKNDSSANSNNSNLIISKNYKELQQFLKTEMKKRLYGFGNNTVFVLENNVVYPKSFSKFWSYIKSEYIKEFTKFRFQSWHKDETKRFKAEISALYDVLEMSQKIDDIETRYDLFLDNIKIEKVNKKLIIFNNKYEFLIPKKDDTSYLTEAEKVEIINDYKKHFEEFDEILRWIIAVNFTGEKRSSFLNLHFTAGFGKSMLMDMFKDLEIGVITKPEKIAKTPSDHKISEISGKLVMMVDEFTTFKKELKEMTHYIRTRELYGYEQKVELGAKLFFNAEKSHSFVNGVDDQILDRVNYITKRSQKLEDREVFKKYANKTYFNVMKEYIYNFIINEINSYLKIGRRETDILSTKIVKEFNEKYTLRKVADNLENTLKTVFIDEINEIINEKYETNLSKVQLEIKSNIFEDGDFIYIKKINKVMELILSEQDTSFQKKGFYKLSDIENVLGTKKITKWYNNKNIKCCKFHKDYFDFGKVEDIEELEKRIEKEKELINKRNEELKKLEKIKNMTEDEIQKMLEIDDEEIPF